MELTAFQVHKSWLIRVALVLVVTALADALAAWFAPRPLLWCALIASSLPLFSVVFVIIPLLRQETRES